MRSPLEPAHPAFQKGEKRARRLLDGSPSGRPPMAAGWERRARVAAQGCCRAGPREARIRIALFRWSPFGRPMAGALWTSYDGSFPAIWVEGDEKALRWRTS